MVGVEEVPTMNQPDILVDIRERLIRMEEQAKGRDARLERVESRLSQMDVLIERFRWWILGGITAAGTVGGVASESIAAALK